MEENNAVVTENENTKTEDKERLTGKEKGILVGACIVIGGIGWFVGNHVAIPLVNTVVSWFGSKKESTKSGTGRKKSKSGVNYDEDGDYQEVNDNDNND
jgi:hypothetical protein